MGKTILFEGKERKRGLQKGGRKNQEKTRYENAKYLGGEERSSKWKERERRCILVI